MTEILLSDDVARAINDAARTRAEQFELAKVPDRAAAYRFVQASEISRDQVMVVNANGDSKTDLIMNVVEDAARKFSLEVDYHWLGGGQCRVTWWMA